MRVIITGGAGFIGSYLAKALLKEGHFVQIIDNLSTGRLDNIESLYSDPNCRVVIGSVQEQMNSLLPADFIFHFAATARIGKSVLSPESTINNNITATTAVLDFVRHKSRDATIVHATTSNLLFTEQPENPYALSKQCCEEILEMYHRVYGVHSYNVRFFNVFGDGEADCGEFTTVIEKFKQLKLSGSNLPIYGDGSQRRAFTYIDDAVLALTMLMRTMTKACETYNIGHTSTWSVQQIAEAFNSTLEYHPSRWFDVQMTINTDPNIPGWEASTSPIEHIKAWLKANTSH